ncbi:MAG: hypothetical protein AABY32_00740 [Nanoarchaeota archaeon]
MQIVICDICGIRENVSNDSYIYGRDFDGLDTYNTVKRIDLCTKCRSEIYRSVLSKILGGMKKVDSRYKKVNKDVSWFEGHKGYYKLWHRDSLSPISVEYKTETEIYSFILFEEVKDDWDAAKLMIEEIKKRQSKKE